MAEVKLKPTVLYSPSTKFFPSYYTRKIIAYNILDNTSSSFFILGSCMRYYVYMDKEEDKISASKAIIVGCPFDLKSLTSTIACLPWTKKNNSLYNQ